MSYFEMADLYFTIVNVDLGRGDLPYCVIQYQLGRVDMYVGIGRFFGFDKFTLGW